MREFSHKESPAASRGFWIIQTQFFLVHYRIESLPPSSHPDCYISHPTSIALLSFFSFTEVPTSFVLYLPARRRRQYPLSVRFCGEDVELNSGQLIPTMAEPEETVKSAGDQQSGQVCSFFRKPVNKKNIRKRTMHDEEDSVSESSFPHSQRKTIKPDNKLFFSTGPSSSSRSSEPGEQSQGFQFESSREIQTQHDSRATATLETETDFSKDARAIRERDLKQAETNLMGNGTNEKLYKGINSYTDYKAGFRREQTIASEKAGGAHGPLRASAHIRLSARFDYQPDICKDYKETGYCGYGDSCKFMHDRGDYKSGWQLEKEWEESEKARRMKLAAGKDLDEGGLR